MPIIAQAIKNQGVEQSGIDTLSRQSLPIYFAAEKTASATSISSSSSSALIQTSTSTSVKTAEATQLPNSAVDANTISYILYFFTAVFIIGLGILSFQNGLKNKVSNPQDANA